MNERARIGIWGAVPIALLHDEKVTFRMLKVYAALASFQGSNDSCFPDRDAISQRSGVEKFAVSKAISALEKLGWVTRKRRPQHHTSNFYQVLFPVSKVADSTTFESLQGGVMHHPKVAESTTFLYMENNKENNTGEKGQTSQDTERVVTYLNEKTGKSFRTKTASTKKKILARLNEGFSVEDFKKVIDLKTAEWLGSPWEKYLRPETLFGSKFEGYLNSVPTEAPGYSSEDPDIFNELYKGEA